MADLSASLVPSVNPDRAPPDDSQHIQANPSSFGSLIAQGEEKAGAGVEQAAGNLFNVAQFHDKISADYSTNNFTDARNRVLYGDPNKPLVGADGSPVLGPDGKPMPDTGYLGLSGSAAAYQREDTLQKLKDLREQERSNLKSPQAQLEFDAQTRRLYSDAEQRIGAHAETQYKGWAGSVNDASAAHSLNDFVGNLNNPDPAVAANHAKDYIDYKVRGAQLKSGGDPAVMAEAHDDARRDIVKAQIAATEVTDPKKAQEILDNRRELLGAQYPALAEQLKGKVAQQQGIADAHREVSAFSDKPYASLSNPSYAAAASSAPGGLSAAGIARTVQIESSGNPNAGAGSAHVGLGQFDVPTALAAGVQNRNDPEQSIRGIATLAAQNAPKLTSALGRAPTDAELYLAHQQGAGGASKLLANPNARAGDLVGDAAIAQNGGDPNAPASAFTNLWKQKFDRASAASGEMGSASALAHREGQIKSKILDDPDMIADPQRQSAALSTVSQLFAAQRLQLAQDDAAFKLKVQNTTEEALQTGSVQNPLPKEQFIATYGATDGEKAYNDYQSTIQLGGDMKATAAMAPEQIHALMDQYNPQPGADDYVDQVKRQGQLATAIRKNEEAKKADPAGFVVSQTPTGQEAWKQFQQLVTAPGTPPAMQTAYAQMYASKILAEQQRIGIPPEARSVVPEWYAKPIRDKVAQAATAEDPKDRQAVIPMIKAQRDLWGDAWSDVAPKLAPPNAAPLVKAIAAGADPAAMQRLLEIPKGENPAGILKEQNEVTAKNMNSAVNVAMAPLLSSMVGAQKDRDFAGYQSLATQLAALYVRDGKSAEQAATDAFNDLIGNRYDFRDTYRIPKAPGTIDPDTVQRGVYEATQQVQRGPQFENNLPAAASALNLNPQEQALYQRHLTNLSGAGGVDNADGSRSTLFQSSVEHDGKTYNIPTVWNGKILSIDDAVKRAQAEGWDKFPAYGSEDEAEARYQQMHKYMEQDTERYQAARTTDPFGKLQLALNDLGVSDNEADTRRGIARDGKFVTSPKNDGLNVLVGTKFVKDTAGNPILLKWDQLQQLGGSKASTVSEASRAVVGSEQSP